MSDLPDLLTGLHGLRVAHPDGWDMLSAAGLGVLIAAGLAALSRSFGRARTTQTAPVEDALSRTDDLAPPDRVAARAALLQRLTDRAAPGERPWTERAEHRFGMDRALAGRLNAGLYRPEGLSDPDADAEALARLCRRASERA